MSASPTIQEVPQVVRVYTNRDGQIDLARHADQWYIYFLGSPTLPSACYKLRGKPNIPC